MIWLHSNMPVCRCVDSVLVTHVVSELWYTATFPRYIEGDIVTGSRDKCLHPSHYVPCLYYRAKGHCNNPRGDSIYVPSQETRVRARRHSDSLRGDGTQLPHQETNFRVWRHSNSPRGDGTQLPHQKISVRARIHCDSPWGDGTQLPHQETSVYTTPHYDPWIHACNVRA